MLGKPALNRLRATTSTYFLNVKFSIAHGIEEIIGDQVLARECYQATLAFGENHIWVINEPEPIPELSETPQEVEIVLGDSTRVLKIGSALPTLDKEKMVSFLRANQDVFSWKHEDVPEIDRKIIHHRLNVNPECKLVQQKRRIFAPERNKAVIEEVEKLLETGFIREVFYLDWLENVVMVKKSNSKWRMCVDFTDLNKAYPNGAMENGECIEVNPDKVKAIIELKSPKTVKEVQSLTRKVAALNRFVSRETDKCIPFFKVLKKAFQWTGECEEALAKLKKYLMKPPLLSPFVIGEELYIYLAVSNTVVSLALIREEENVQKLVYYTSQAFQGAEANCRRMEKIDFALVVASKKLRPYFQAHSIVVMTD
ncbi:uncharacterized protein LOC142634839 [Castanea sativa]|uniref:uncharacterized protein LOC142634839 n=1 Tax=Castanea sativa TaxID=21020 RepID=UPI003F65429B